MKEKKRIKYHLIHAEKLRPRVPIHKMYWEFHKGDSDFNPSVPHGHSLNGKYKLELWSGNIYEVSTGAQYATAKSKDMSKLYHYPGFLEFIRECREEYAARFPGITLSPLSPNNKIPTNIKNHIGKRNSIWRKVRYLFLTEFEIKE